MRLMSWLIQVLRRSPLRWLRIRTVAWLTQLNFYNTNNSSDEFYFLCLQIIEIKHTLSVSCQKMYSGIIGMFVIFLLLPLLLNAWTYRNLCIWFRIFKTENDIQFSVPLAFRDSRSKPRSGYDRDRPSAPSLPVAKASSIDPCKSNVIVAIHTLMAWGWVEAVMHFPWIVSHLVWSCQGLLGWMICS